MTEINIIGDTTVNGDGTQITTTGDITINGDDAVVNVTEALEIPEYKAADLPVDGSVKLAWLIPDDGEIGFNVPVYDQTSSHWYTHGSNITNRVLVHHNPTEIISAIRGALQSGWTGQVVQGWTTGGLTTFRKNTETTSYDLPGVAILNDGSGDKTVLMPIVVSPS